MSIVSIARCNRERDPAGHLKHPAINEGGLPDDKSLAITEMRKKVAYKANCCTDIPLTDIAEA